MRLAVHPEKCTGCLRCQLICSFIYTKKFNIARARLTVIVEGSNGAIEFAEDCNNCGKCAEHCFYGALEKIEEGD